GRSCTVHRVLVRDRVGVVTVEAEQVELLGRLRLLRRFVGKAGVPLLLQPAVLVRAAFFVGLSAPGIGRTNHSGPVVGASLWVIGIIAIAKGGRRCNTRSKTSIFEIAQLLGADRRHARDKNQLVGGRK